MSTTLNKRKKMLYNLLMSFSSSKSSLRAPNLILKASVSSSSSLSSWNLSFPPKQVILSFYFTSTDCVELFVEELLL